MISSIHPLTWFEQRVDTVIHRGNRPFKITNKRDAEYCYELQSEGFTFQEIPVRKVRVHIMDNNCTACEA